MAAAVVVKGNTTTGTASDMDGNFTLSVPSDAVLVIQSLGYETKEVAVNGKTNLGTIIVNTESLFLDQVVVIGYGTQKKADLTGSVAVVEAEELKRVSHSNISSMLEGKVAGVNITTDGQPAFARFAPYFSSDSGIDERDKIIREDPVYNWHEDWKGTFYSDLSEMDIVIEGGTPAAQASAQAARIIKDHINNIIMAESEAKAIELYEQALKELEAYNISAWEEEINRQIHAKREKLNG